jgi:hypothetical protein
MALKVADRVKETSTTTGTGAIALDGADSNFVTFSSFLSDGDTTYYAIVDHNNTEYEIGIGTYNATPNTLTRTTILDSSNSGAAVNLAAGQKDVFVTYPAEKSVYLDASGTLTFSNGTDITLESGSTINVGASGVDAYIFSYSPAPVFGLSFNAPSGTYDFKDGTGSAILAIPANAGNETDFTYSGNTIFTDGYHPNADKWTTARSISLTGNIGGSVSLDGSANVSIATSVVPTANDSFTGTYSITWHSGTTLYTSSWLQIDGLNDRLIVPQVNAGVRIDAPIFYDSGNTSYYLDPASTSSLNVLNVDGLTVDGSATITGNGTTNQLVVNNNSAGSAVSPQYADIEFNGYSTSTRARIRGVDRASNFIYGGLILQTASDGTTQVDRLFIEGNGDISFYNTAGTSQSFFWDASAERLGLGTSSPAAKLHIESTGTVLPRVTSSDGSGDAGFRFYSGTSYKGQIGWDQGVDAIGIYSAGSSTVPGILINSSGNVGIGTTNPSTKFEIYNAGFSSAQISGDSTSETQLRFSGNTAARISNLSNTALIFSTNAAERMRIDSSGNVGIGDSAPTEKLVVSRLGNNWAGVAPPAITTAFFHSGTTNDGSGAAITLAGGDTAPNAIYFSNESDNDVGAIIYSNNDDSMQFRVSGTERMRIDSSGSVTANVDFRAPIFYDSNDTTYYVNPASTSLLNTLVVAGDLNVGLGNDTNWITMDVADGSTERGGISIGESGKWGSASMHMYYTGDGYFHMGMGAMSASTHAANRAMRFYYLDNDVLFLGSATSNSSFSAPIFYDSADTSYYVDPAGSSRLNILDFSGSSNLTGSSQYIQFNSTATSGGFKMHDSSDTLKGYFYFDPSGIGVLIGGTWGLKVDYSGNNFATTSSRAPIFYDSDNTAYYLNPASTSDVNILNYNRLDGPATSSRDKIRVYSSSSYAIGMQSAVTYGGLNDWAMTFQFSNESDRGFWWGHEGHTTAQGAMSLTTAGHLFVGSRVDAPIFYDSDNTAYYTNPASTSSLNSINMTGWLTYNDGERNANNAVWYPNVQTRAVRWFFALASSVGSGGNYAGVMHFSPWSGTTSSTGDASYQLAFGSTAVNGGGVPQLRIRKGIDTTWNSFYNIHHDGYADMYATSSFRAPIFYDSNDTSYYVDPASLTNLKALRVNNATNTGVTEIGTIGNDSANGYTRGSIVMSRNANQITWDTATNLWTYDGGGSTDFSLITSAINEGLSFFVGSGVTTPTTYTHTDFKDNFLHLNITSSGNATFFTDVRAPIFYDSDDTAFYVNPAGTNSRIRASFIGANEAYLYESATNAMAIRTGASGAYKYFTFGADGTFNALGGRVTAATDMRAPIFYDSDNTSYYWNPNYNSGHRLNTVSGYLIAGPQNTSYCHFSTDRGSFYFDKTVTFDGDGIRMYDTAADVRSYIFYDQNDSSYYVDPNLTSVLNDLTVNGLIYGNGSQAQRLNLEARGQHTEATLPSGWGDYVRTWEFVETGDWSFSYGYVDNINMYSNSASWQFFYAYTNDATTPIRFRNATYSSDAWFGWREIVDTGGSAQTKSGSLRSSDDMRAPLFYDIDNTAYYVNAAGNSFFHEIRIDDILRHNGDTDTYFQFHAADQARIVTGGAERFEVNNTYVMANDQFRTPLIYDLNNTAYYVDPNGTSVLSTLNMVGIVTTRENTSAFTSANDTTLSVRGNTSYGAVMSFHRPDAYAVNFGLDTDNKIKIGGWSMGSVAYPVIHTGNYDSELSGGSISTATNGGGVNYVYASAGGTPTRGDCAVHVYHQWSANLSLTLTHSSWQRGDMVVIKNSQGINITVTATRIYLPDGSYDTSVTFNGVVGSFTLIKYNTTNGYWMVGP